MLDTNSLLNIGVGLASGEGRGLDLDVRGLGDDFGAVNHVVDIVAEYSELLESGLEGSLKLDLIVHERLPFASSPRVTGELSERH